MTSKSVEVGGSAWQDGQPLPQTRAAQPEEAGRLPVDQGGAGGASGAGGVDCMGDLSDVVKTVPATLQQQAGTDLGADSTWPPFLQGQTEHPVRVLVVDDDAHIRRVIVQELMGDPRVTVLGQAASSREGQRLMAAHEFDVLLVDLNLLDGSGFELIHLMKRMRPLAEAIVVTAMDTEEHALHAFEIGAAGFLVKHSWFGNYAQAVLQVVNGGASITPNLARRLLRRLGETASAQSRRTSTDEQALSEREKTVLRMVAAGYTSAEVARNLSISAPTVNTHIKNIYRKLRVRTRAQAVSQATSSGLL